MLILTRKPGEKICIGDDIDVTILGTNGRSVRVGIDAPEHIVVDREEVSIRRRQCEADAEYHSLFI